MPPKKKKSSVAKKPAASPEVERLERKMKMLQYRKNQTNRKIRGTLHKSNELERADMLKQLSMDRAAENTQWARSIIENELMQPLEVTDEFITNYKERELREQARYHKEAQIHIRSLTNLQNNMRKRAYEKDRLSALTTYQKKSY